MQWFGQHGEGYLNNLPLFFEQVKGLSEGVAGLVTSQEVLGQRIDVLTTQLNDRMPEVGKAQEDIKTSLEGLTRRDRELSEELKRSFAEVEAKIAEVAVKSSCVESMQSSIRDIVAKQRVDFDSAKVDIERAVTDARARIDLLTGNRVPSIHFWLWVSWGTSGDPFPSRYLQAAPLPPSSTGIMKIYRSP